MATLDRALQIAASAHEGQTDRYGAPYILHPVRVMQSVTNTEEKIVAILHDVIEDSEWTIDGLREQGFDEATLAAVDALTRRDNETYEEYIDRLLPNPLARTVKIADLQDNMDLQRAKQSIQDDAAKFVRNHHAWMKLQGITN